MMSEGSIDPALIDALGLKPPTPPKVDHDARLHELVEELPPDLRDVVELLFWGRERPADIARMLGCSRPAVYDRMNRACTILKKGLQDAQNL